MEQQKILAQFFREHGSCIEDAQSGMQTKGILSPIRDLGTEQGNLGWQAVGFSPKQEFVVLAPCENGVLVKNSVILAEGKRFKIIATDTCFVGAQPFYERAYLMVLREKGVLGC